LAQEQVNPVRIQRDRDVRALTSAQVSNVTAAVRCNYDALKPSTDAQWQAILDDCNSANTNAAQNRRILIEVVRRSQTDATAIRKSSKQAENLTEAVKVILKTQFPELWREVR
jgi:hypothetical protein